MLRRRPVPGDRVLISENATKYVVAGMKQYFGTIVTVKRVDGDDFTDEQSGCTWWIGDAIEAIISDEPVKAASDSDLKEFLGF